MQLNAEDGGNRRFIMVQLPEPCDEKSEAFKAGYKTIAEISKERIRRAGKKILEELEPQNTRNTQKKENKDDLFGEADPSVFSVCSVVKKLDIGFRVLKIDSSNMADIYYTPDAIEQGQLKIFTDNIKPDREPEDLLFQVLLDWGVDLSLPIRKEAITTEHTEHTEKNKNKISVSSVYSVVKKSFEVFFVDENALIACFDTGVNEDLVKKLAGFKPMRVVFRDTGFASDAVKINVEQIFKQMSPGTEVKSI
jgi:adenine-specific DNA-methyltransferase